MLPQLAVPEVMAICGLEAVVVLVAKTLDLQVVDLVVLVVLVVVP